MIIVRIWEGLGNQLFQYAFARALSLSTDRKVFLDVKETGSGGNEKGLTPRKYGLKYFKTALPVCTNVKHFYPYLNRNDDFLQVMQMLSVAGMLPYKFYKEDNPDYKDYMENLHGNWYLQGWFQDCRYFQKYGNILKKEIVPRNKITVSAALRNILRMENTVSVHIRRTDYKKTFNILPVGYYDRAMNHMGRLVAHPFWVVFSDDTEWVKNHIDFGRDCYFVGEKENLQDYQELMVMSNCRNHIIANSTFSWWGAWLGRNENKVVIGPDKWMVKAIRKHGESILPEDWIKEPV